MPPEFSEPSGSSVAASHASASWTIAKWETMWHRPARSRAEVKYRLGALRAVPEASRLAAHSVPLNFSTLSHLSLFASRTLMPICPTTVVRMMCMQHFVLELAVGFHGPWGPTVLVGEFTVQSHAVRWRWWPTVLVGHQRQHRIFFRDPHARKGKKGKAKAKAKAEPEPKAKAPWPTPVRQRAMCICVCTCTCTCTCARVCACACAWACA